MLLATVFKDLHFLRKTRVPPLQFYYTNIIIQVFSVQAYADVFFTNVKYRFLENSKQAYLYPLISRRY